MMSQNLEYDKFAKELYEQMKQEQIVGSFSLVEDMIHWNIGDYFIEIARDYLSITIVKKLYSLPITHWHPEDDEVLDEIRQIGTKGNVTVIYDGWFAGGPIYAGPRECCPCKRKWLFGKYYYIYAD